MLADFRRRSRGSAAVEFLLCLPVLILLAFPIADLARVLQADMVLTNIAREGANLASRTANAEHAIMESLAATATPLDMRSNGVIRITKILAHEHEGITRNVVIEQHQWVRGTYRPSQGVWQCGASGSYWDGNGRCNGLPSPSSAPTVEVMPGLRSGDVVYLVEVFYRFPLFFSEGLSAAGISFPIFDPDLYAMAIF